MLVLDRPDEHDSFGCYLQGYEFTKHQVVKREDSAPGPIAPETVSTKLLTKLVL